MKFAQRIREVRQERGLTQKQFGEFVGKAESTVRAWELEASYPTCKALIAIARRTGKTSDYLLGITEESKAAAGEPKICAGGCVHSYDDPPAHCRGCELETEGGE